MGGAERGGTTHSGGLNCLEERSFGGVCSPREAGGLSGAPRGGATLAGCREYQINK